MSIVEDSSLKTPAIPAQGTNAQANSNATHHMGAAALEGIALTRRYITRAHIVTKDVIKPAIETFLETCETHPRIAALVATPALLGFLLALALFTISTLVLVVWTILTVTSGIIFVILAGILSLFFKLLVVVLATLPLAAIATGLLVGANSVSQSIISRMPQNNSVGPAVTRTVRETDWTSITEHLIDLGKILGPGSVTVLEKLMTALYNFWLAFKSGTKDPQNTRVENRVRNDLPGDSTAETSSEQTSVFEYGDLRELQPTGSSEGLKRRATTAYNETRE